jgi:uncharacterized repeat protein (TIGR04052 family)
MRHVPIVLMVAFAGCGGSSSPNYQIQFSPLVGGQPFSCSQTYSGIGTSMTTISPLDFRMYVNSVQLIRADGTKVPLQLEDDGKWQLDNIAYLDFEDGTGTCMTGSPETNFVVRGTAPAHDDYNAVEFTVGLPSDHDHLDAAVAKAPLNQPAMWWSWLGGYRYLKLDVQSTMNPSWFFHLGAENCIQASGAGIDCKYPNLPDITVANFTPGKSQVAFDVATLFADSNLDADANLKTDEIPGCMSSPGDSDCPPIYDKLGLSFEDAGTAPAQTAFVAK